jgi:hypothetical protein
VLLVKTVNDTPSGTTDNTGGVSGAWRMKRANESLWYHFPGIVLHLIAEIAG